MNKEDTNFKVCKIQQMDEDIHHSNLFSRWLKLTVV